MMTTSNSLDQQYLEFTADANDVFGRFPRLEPLRYCIFRELLVQRQAVGLPRGVKYAMQRAWSGRPNVDAVRQSDVLIWIESTRDVIIDALLPVYRELIARGARVQLISYGGPHGLPPSTVPFHHHSHFLAPAWTRQAWDHFSLIFEELHGRGLYRSFYHLCAIVEGLFEGVQQLLDKIQPKVVLCAATNFIGGAGVTLASRWNGSRPMLLQHGMTQAFYTPLISDCMLTWGPSTNHTLASLGVPTQRLFALGSPRHDAMRPPSNAEARLALLRALSLPDRPTLVFFSNGNDLLHNGMAPLECTRWLETAAAAHRASWNVVVRLHPNEDGRLYRACSHVHVTKDKPDLSTTLGGCEVVGSLCSTVLYDALLYEKPVLQFYRDGWPELADNWRHHYSMRVMSSEHLTEVLSFLQPGREQYQDIVRKQHHNLSAVFANRGSATQAIADYVMRAL